MLSASIHISLHADLPAVHGSSVRQRCDSDHRRYLPAQTCWQPMADAVCHPNLQETHMTIASEFVADSASAGQIPLDAATPESTPRLSARTSRMAHDVYISYSHVDKAAADAACATLERAGIRCWIAPRDITPGDEWSAAIVKAIDHCRAMVLIFSTSANNSRQIPREVERAINVGIPLVPVRIEDVAPTQALAYFMSTVHWLDAMTPPFEDHLNRLADSLKALLQVSAPMPAAAAP